jgi:hypothetical protein
MDRTRVILDLNQERALKQLAAEESCTVAEVIRRAVDAYVSARLNGEADAGR